MTRTLFVSRHRLTACPGCHAHVRVQAEVLASACDFCGTQLSSAPTRDVFQRLLDMGGTTGGVVAATLLGLGLVHCSNPPTIDLRPDTGDQMVVPLYGIPPVDSGLSDAAIVDARASSPDTGQSSADATEPPPVPLYGIAPVDAGSDKDVVVADAEDPPPEPDYGISPIGPDAAVVDADDPPPVALYGISPVDAGTRGADARVRPDAEDPTPAPLYGIAPVDAGVQDADEGPVTPLYGGAAVQTPSDEILS